MKPIQNGFVIALFLLVGAFSQLSAAEFTNTSASFQESWQTISNRWASTPLEKIKQTAEQGDVTAQYYLGCNYKNEDGVEYNPTEAFKWMNLAAQQGMPRAQFFLGWMYDSGSGVEQDYSEAAKFYRLAAGQGHAIAQNNLGLLYKKGSGVPEDQIEAVKWFQKSAEQGERFGAENLAWIYAAGVYGPSNTFGQGAEAQVRSGGVAPNHELAEKWMRQAVDLNSVEGQYQYGDLLYGEFDNEGHQDTKRFSDAAEWFRKAAEQGYAKAQYQLADMYHSGELGDDQRSNCIPWFLKAAAQGNAQAQAVVGELTKYYPNSELLKSVDNIETLRQSGEQGNLDAQFQLARRYQTGNGVPKDAIEAFKWMQRASQHDQTESSKVSDALYELALMYEKGEGVTNDLSKAHDLFVQAATGHQPDATFRVGQMYEKGDGVPQDDHQAMELYCNKIYNMNYPDKYPSGFVEYGGPGNRSVESVLRLWSEGRGVQNDKDKAEPGYHETADLITYWVQLIKTAKAQFYTGEIYYQGKVVPQDLIEAAAWFQLAASQGSDEARKALDELEPNMSPVQKEAAKSRCDILEKIFERVKITDEANEKAKAFKAW